MNTLYAHGKLLISAEYMVMHGSGALAVPLNQGQSLLRLPPEKPGLFSWKALYGEKVWFNSIIDPTRLRIVESSDQSKSEILLQMIRAAIELQPSFQQELFKWDVETHLEFSPVWGFGSSSSLTALLAEWAEVNPLDLHFIISDGSGYDVACAIANGPILYKLRNDTPHYQHVPFHPPFSDQLYFAWLGNKQSTREHLDQLSGRIKPTFEEIYKFSNITDLMIKATDLKIFRELMEEHEAQLSDHLGLERVSSSRFSGLPGTVKSLGAWGGDFVMIATDETEANLFAYLHDREINVIFRYEDIVYDTTQLQDEPGD